MVKNRENHAQFTGPPPLNVAVPRQPLSLNNTIEQGNCEVLAPPIGFVALSLTRVGDLVETTIIDGVDYMT